jgi:transcriptional regulatory protein RtcR
LKFATGNNATWTGNFRDLSASITRLATLSAGGRISLELVKSEIERLRRLWTQGDASDSPSLSMEIDPFDQVQLAHVIGVCKQSKSLSDAGRKLFAVSRKSKRIANDADRLKKYLARFGLTFAEIAGDIGD